MLMESLVAAHRKRPIGMYVMYDTNWFLRTAVKLSRPFLPFKVCTADSFEEGLQSIRNGFSGVSRSHVLEPWEVNPSDEQEPDEIQSYADELIRFIGSIHWDREGIEVPRRDIDPSHPFSSVFDAISFIKGELDDHFQERRKAEERFLIFFRQQIIS